MSKYPDLTPTFGVLSITKQVICVSSGFFSSLEPRINTQVTVKKNVYLNLCVIFMSLLSHKCPHYSCYSPVLAIFVHSALFVVVSPSVAQSSHC